MPEPGDQHKSAGTSSNPFEEAKPHISEYSAKEIATLSSRLEKQLGPEYISSRPGAGGKKVHYVTADKCINLANDVFGFNGWSSGIQNVQVDFVDENESTGKISLGLSVIVRVTLRDGAFHEDIGYGQIENCKGKAAAFEKAKKEGTTDALKRALRHFGNVLGNCVYDKEYLSKVTRLKIAPTKWDVENLHRHSDYLPIKKDPNEAYQKSSFAAIPGRDCSIVAEDHRPIDDSDLTLGADAEDEFGSDEFDEADFHVAHDEPADERNLETAISSRDLRRASSLQSLDDRKIPQLRPHAARTDSPAADKMRQSPSKLGAFTSNLHSILPREAGIDRTDVKHPQSPTKLLPRASLSRTPSSALLELGGPARPLVESHLAHEKKLPQNHNGDKIPLFDTIDAVDYAAPVGFFTARAAETVQNGSNLLPVKAAAFNPHLESPSIRKTVGVDHTKTKPVGRDSIPISPSILSAAAAPSRPNFIINPQVDKNRKVGMPIGAVSPLQNRNSYKPLQIKRPAEGDPAVPARPALADVTSTTVNVPSDPGPDAKRQRVMTGGGGGIVGPGG